MRDKSYSGYFAGTLMIYTIMLVSALFPMGFSLQEKMGHMFVFNVLLMGGTISAIISRRKGTMKE